jgi:beta-glucosidase
LNLIKEGGLDAYRFSFAWPSLLPESTGRPNPAGLAFYDRLLDGMLGRPSARLRVLPVGPASALQDRGRWMNRDIAG